MPSSARAQIGRQLSGFQPPLGAGMVVALAEALHVVLPDRLRGPSGARLGSGCGEQMHAGDHEDISVDRQPLSPRGVNRAVAKAWEVPVAGKNSLAVVVTQSSGQRERTTRSLDGLPQDRCHPGGTMSARGGHSGFRSNNEARYRCLDQHAGLSTQAASLQLAPACESGGPEKNRERPPTQATKRNGRSMQ